MAHFRWIYLSLGNKESLLLEVVLAEYSDGTTSINNSVFLFCKYLNKIKIEDLYFFFLKILRFV